MIKKLPSGRFQVDLQPNGRGGRRVRKSFATRAEAKRFHAYLEAEAAQGREWNPPEADKRHLSDLVRRWYDLHGHTLKDAKYRYMRTLELCQRLGDPKAATFTGGDFATYRTARLKSGTKPATVNHEHAYLRAVFNELKRLGEWEAPNPMATLRRVKNDETELAFLTVEQIRDLLAALEDAEHPDCKLIVRVCLATGCRWSEAEGLKAHQIANQKITFTGTKNGKNRTVPISAELFDDLKAHKKSGRMFVYSRRPWRNALKAAGIELPPGQSTHVLRHTFASHFMMQGGNILTLQRILGHSDIKMTMRYSHLAPDHLQDAVTKNPLTLC